MNAKDPTIPVVLAEDTAALCGLAIALVAVGLSDVTGWSGWDSVGSLLIGVLLALVAWFLAGRTHSLLLGEAVTTEDEERIKALTKSVAGAKEVRQLLSYHLGPKTVILALKVEFERGLDVAGIEERINGIEKAIRAELPHMRYIFVEPDATYLLQLDEDRPLPDAKRPPSDAP